MKTLALFGNKRSQIGKTNTKAIRTEGKVPCVLYGGKENLHFTIYEADFKQLVYTPNTYKVQLDVDGQIFKTILKDIQFHPVNDSIIHADFFEINEDIDVELYIPIKFKGNAIGVRNGGKLIVKSSKIRVRGLPKNLPDFLEVDVEGLEIGKAIKIKDLSSPNIILLDSPDNLVVTVRVTRAVVEEVKTVAPIAAAPAAPVAEAKDTKKK